MPNRAYRRGMMRAFENLLKNDKLLSSLPSTPAAQPGNDPIIAEYIAWRRLHPQGPLPKSLTDKMAAAFPGVDLKQVGKDFVSDMLSDAGSQKGKRNDH
jgi:hypothetical protein